MKKKRKKVPLIKISFSRESKKVKYFKRDESKKEEKVIVDKIYFDSRTIEKKIYTIRLERVLLKLF